MKVEMVVNGNISIALIPETELEEIAIKMLAKQDNEFTEVRSQTQILNKVTFAKGLIIQPKSRVEGSKSNLTEELEEAEN